MMWKEKYKIGIEEIDRQHQELFQRVSNFIQKVRSDGNWDEKKEQVKETLEFMNQYVITHFDAEEAYQEKIGFPEREQHKAIHESFKTEVQTYNQRFEQEGYNEELLQEFAGKLMAWLINHVAATDQKMGEYVAKTGGGSDES